MDAPPPARHDPPMHALSKAGGTRLTELRTARRLSQLELAFRAGVSQRHLSCIETGRAQPSREMLLALLEALGATLVERNDALLAAGYAPVYGHRPLDAPELRPVRAALEHLLKAHDPAPALVLDATWNLVQSNQGLQRLARLLGLGALPVDGSLNLLRATFAPGGIRGLYLNADEICGETWRRASREALHVPELRAILAELAPHAEPFHVAAPAGAAASAPPVVTARLASPVGELRFLSTFTTFGAPLDVTVASLRVEHLFPADAATWAALSAG
ncbi:MAG: helix-turn-helix domain-containing protein [Pseudomonadota bacterium]